MSLLDVNGNRVIMLGACITILFKCSAASSSAGYELRLLADADLSKAMQNLENVNTATGGKTATNSTVCKTIDLTGLCDPNLSGFAKEYIKFRQLGEPDPRIKLSFVEKEPKVFSKPRKLVLRERPFQPGAATEYNWLLSYKRLQYVSEKVRFTSTGDVKHPTKCAWSKVSIGSSGRPRSTRVYRYKDNSKVHPTVDFEFQPLKKMYSDARQHLGEATRRLERLRKLYGTETRIPNQFTNAGSQTRSVRSRQQVPNTRRKSFPGYKTRRTPRSSGSTPCRPTASSGKTRYRPRYRVRPTRPRA